MSKTQMNTRIEEAVKERGDAAFATIGWTPSHVVQTVWEIAAADSTFPILLKEIAEKPQKSAHLLHEEALAEEVFAGAHITDQFYETLGISKPTVKQKIDYHKLREDAFADRWSKQDTQ